MRRGRVQPSEFPRLTLSRALLILDESDPDDAHRGGIEVRSAAQLAALCGVDSEDED